MSAQDLPSLAASLSADNVAGYDIFVGVNPRTGHGRKGDSAVRLARCLFADVDQVTPEEALERCAAAGLPVSTMVISSGHGTHLYWRLTAPIENLQAFRSLQKRLAILLGADQTIVNPERVMRLPGFLNVKKDPAVPCWIVQADPSRRVDLADIEKGLGNLQPDAKTGQETGPQNAAVPAADLDAVAAAMRHLASVPPAIQGEGGDERTYKAACSMRDFGLSEDQACSAMTLWNQRCTPPWSEQDLRTKIHNAYAYAKLPAGSQLERPEVQLPGGSVSITESAACIAQLLAKEGKVFGRGGAIVAVEPDRNDVPTLRPVKPAELASLIESVARPVILKKIGDRQEMIPTTCSESKANLIMHAKSFRDTLPTIHVVSRCPVLAERDGGLVQINGYDQSSGIMTAGAMVPEVPLDVAKKLIDDVVADFHFATEGDRARALAAIITPALILGGLPLGRAPLDLGEADASQSGKGYRNKLTAAIYNCKVKTIAQRRGGVGSFEETLSSVLMRGGCFISLDNARGLISSPAMESMLTEDTYQARVPYQRGAEIDPRRVILMMTSNKAEITPDLANRSSCVRILRQPDGYRFRKYPEGDILDHVRANQPQYLGAVFSIIRAWHAAGKPHTEETRHDFRGWAQTLDWICQRLLGTVPLLDGHRQAQERMTSPALNWLRELAIVVIKSGKAGNWLRADELLELLLKQPVADIPGLREGGDIDDPRVRSTVLQAMGRRLGQCFSGNILTLDGMIVERQEVRDRAAREVRQYRFAMAEGSAIAQGNLTGPGPDPATSTGSGNESPLCTPCTIPVKPPMDPLNPLIPPIPANIPQQNICTINTSTINTYGDSPADIGETKGYSGEAGAQVGDGPRQLSSESEPAEKRERFEI